MGRFFQAPTSSDPYSVSKVAFLSSRPRSRSVALSLLFALLPLLAPQAALGQEDEHDEIARRVLRSVPLFDGHNDLPWAIRNAPADPRDVDAYGLRGDTEGHTDMDRLRAGMVGAQFWSVYVPYGAVEEGAARVQLDNLFCKHIPTLQTFFRGGRI